MWLPPAVSMLDNDAVRSIHLDSLPCTDVEGVTAPLYITATCLRPSRSALVLRDRCNEANGGLGSVASHELKNLFQFGRRL